MDVEASAIPPARSGHAGWVRFFHGWVAAAVLTLAASGFVILKAHPRLYWGPVGNDLTPALVELPISRNYHHGGWTPAVPFFPPDASRVSAARTFDIYNENGWARSLHFLAAWLLVVPGIAYALLALLTGHLRRDLLPGWRELWSRDAWRESREHLRRPPETVGTGPPYSLLQKIAYGLVVCALLPLMWLTGLTMSPAATTAWPSLLVVFNGSQSARTIHFAVFSLLVIFVAAHVALVIQSGLVRQLRGMTIGGPR